VPNTVAIAPDDLAKQISSLVPGFMKSGAMSDMPMNMALPENTLSMMGGSGPYGNIEMGGMFTVMKIRPHLAHDDYRDPGWYKAPPGSVAHLWEGESPPAERDAGAAPIASAEVPFKVHKPSGPMEH
jgi:hypothetical protein